MISILALWVLVLFETFLLALLLRALGELRQRGELSSSGSTQAFVEHIGLPISSQAPPFVAKDHNGASVKLEDTNGQWRIIAFISSGCGACAGAIEALNEFLGERQDFAVLIVGDTDLESNKAYAAEHAAIVPILTPEPMLTMEIYLVRRFPFVYIIDEAGVIRAKSTINNREHLRLLLEDAGVSARALQKR